MNDYSWMYRVLSERLRMMNYCKGVENFINYTLSNPKNIGWNGIRYPCKRCKNKTFLHLDVVTMHLLQKWFTEKYFCWFTYGEPYVPYETMIERMVGSTSSSSNVHGVVNDNNNCYSSMVMDAMRMNQSDANKCSIIDEEQNKNALGFFYSLKDSDEPLWDEWINHSRSRVIEVCYDIIIE